MANVVGPDCVDTASAAGLPCTYPAKELGGQTTISPNVYFQGEKVEHYPVAENIVLSSVVGTPIPPNTTCLPGDRVLKPKANTSVHINGKLFSVTGDETVLVFAPGTPRPLTGPYKYPKILIGTRTP